MANPNTDFLEKAAVFGLSVPAAMMAGNMAANVAEHGHLSREARDRAQKVQAVKDKTEEDKRKKEPSEGGTNKVAAENKAYKKGGKVSSASKRADGCCTKGKTRGRMV